MPPLCFAADLTLLTAAEDVGRHNALDKAVGRLLLDGTLSTAGLLVLSSRISFDLVTEGPPAPRVAVIFSMSRPTRPGGSKPFCACNMTLAACPPAARRRRPKGPGWQLLLGSFSCPRKGRN
ncbi:MAG: formate dehydrogenase accessory sulfurtransferase FdhD [Desulfobacterales bacterium]|nr:formate dehydrogenase accessory sulfurtransferase FdhD [Desulfobacterales bacterium]